MAIKGEQRVQADYQKKVGFDEMKVIAFNPTKEELEGLLNIPNMREPTYIGTFKDTDTDKEYPTVNVSVWFQGAKSQSLFNARFNIIKRERWNKDNTKQQFINDVGSTAWGASAEALKALALDMTLAEGTRNFYKGFTTRNFRPALSGEDKLYDFLQKFTNIDTRDAGVEISLDSNRLFKGNFSELHELMESEYAKNTLCGCATIRVVPGVPTTENPNPDFKEYQSIYEEFLPGSYIRYFQANITGRPDYVKKFIASMEGEYGSKDFYIIGPIRDYVSTENPAVRELLRVAAVQNGSVPATNTAEMGAHGQPVDDLPF